jgi:DNA polymerase-3 subunit gamma/tau
MFDNIIGQDEITGLLREDRMKNRLPGALLLEGPEFSGKLSIALELARILSCEAGDAEWSCGCRTCEFHRLLAHPHTLLIGGRYFYPEAAACADTLRRTAGRPARYLFIRSIRKLLRRFDPVLWEGEETKLQALLPSLAAAEEAIQELMPEKELPPAKRMEELIETALGAVKKITAAKAVSIDSIPIALIRRISVWAHLGAGGAAKVVIIENADNMLNASRNALLKILEEPPPHVTFILLTSRRSAILPTILSRARTYRLAVRDEAADREVLKKIFREDSGMISSLKDFFRTFQDINPDTLRKAVLDFLRVTASSGTESFSDMAENGSWFTDKIKFRFFLQELFEVFRLILGAVKTEETLPDIPLEKIEEWTALVRKTWESLDIFNIAPAPLAQRLYYAFRRH